MTNIENTNNNPQLKNLDESELLAAQEAINKLKDSISKRIKNTLKIDKFTLNKTINLNSGDFEQYMKNIRHRKYPTNEGYANTLNMLQTLFNKHKNEISHHKLAILQKTINKITKKQEKFLNKQITNLQNPPPTIKTIVNNETNTETAIPTTPVITKIPDTHQPIEASDIVNPAVAAELNPKNKTLETANSAEIPIDNENITESETANSAEIPETPKKTSFFRKVLKWSGIKTWYGLKNTVKAAGSLAAKPYDLTIGKAYQYLKEKSGITMKMAAATGLGIYSAAYILPIFTVGAFAWPLIIPAGMIGAKLAAVVINKFSQEDVKVIRTKETKVKTDEEGEGSKLTKA